MSKNKNNDKLFDYVGYWYVPGLSKKLEGYLRTKKKHLYLELFTENTFENQSLSEGVKVQYSNYPIIIGKSIRNGTCTLYKCTWAGCKQISERRYRLKYEVQFAFLNALIEDENKFLVRNADFSFSYLSSWYDGAKSTSRLSPHTGVFINGTEQTQDTRNAQKIVNVTDNIDFVFIDSFERHEIQWGNSYENRFQKYLRIGFKVPVPFEELISVAAYFSNLLEVCLFRQVPFTVHDIAFTEEAYSHLQSNPYNTIKSSYVLNYSLSNWINIVDGVMHQHHMLISRWKFEETALDDIIRNWFSNRSYSHIYDYFIDSHLWEVGSRHFVTNVIFNNKFLNMLHGIEGFHRLFYENKKYDNTDFLYSKTKVLKLVTEPKLKKWMNDNLNPPKHKYETLTDKIEHLIDEFEPFLLSIFGNITITRNFFLRVVKYRNTLSHGSQKSTNQGEEFGKLFYAIQYLLALCILKSLNIDSPDKTIKDNMHLADSAHSIITYVNKNIEQYTQSNG